MQTLVIKKQNNTTPTLKKLLLFQIIVTIITFAFFLLYFTLRQNETIRQILPKLKPTCAALENGLNYSCFSCKSAFVKNYTC